jgi:hypothetical protein
VLLRCRRAATPAPGTTFEFSVYAFDNYFTGNQTDAIEGMTYTLDTPRFVPSFQALVTLGSNGSANAADACPLHLAFRATPISGKSGTPRSVIRSASRPR